VTHDLSDVRFLTVAEVAGMMRVSKMTVYRALVPRAGVGRRGRAAERRRRRRLTPLSTFSGRPSTLTRGIFPRFCFGPGRPIHESVRSSMGSVIKKRRKRMAKKKHRKLLRKTRHQRRNKK
jgi:hypothetical protein